MREFSIEEGLKKTISRLCRKDKVTYEILMKKMEEITHCDDINHYKNLRRPLQEFKRAHIRGSFVLIFKHNPSKDKVLFYYFDHHDYVYERKEW